jgi:hypothetical protein
MPDRIPRAALRFLGVIHVIPLAGYDKELCRVGFPCPTAYPELRFASLGLSLLYPCGVLFWRDAALGVPYDIPITGGRPCLPHRILTPTRRFLTAYSLTFAGAAATMYPETIYWQ